MMKQEIVYLGHDNYIDLILMANGVAQDLTGITKMTLTFGTKLVSSTNLSTDPILWKQAGYGTGEIRIFLGKQSITPGNYSAPLILFDPVNVDGVVWDYVNVEIKAEVQGT